MSRLLVESNFSVPLKLLNKYVMINITSATWPKCIHLSYKITTFESTFVHVCLCVISNKPSRNHQTPIKIRNFYFHLTSIWPSLYIYIYRPPDSKRLTQYSKSIHHEHFAFDWSLRDFSFISHLFWYEQQQKPRSVTAWSQFQIVVS